MQKKMKMPLQQNKLEMISFQDILAFKSLFSNTKCIWHLVNKLEYPVLCRIEWKVKSLFSLTNLYMNVLFLR
nr:unnamed protein product [Callosobruchus chinensis]